MNRKIFNLISALAVMLLTLPINAAEPDGYYRSAEGKTGQALLKALEGIVGPHTTVSYDGLWTMYKYTDVGSDGYILDMYSTTKFKPGTNQCGSYSKVGDCYNREHSFPKSWFNDASPMVSDAFHIVPTDGYVNNQRSNYPFGVCANGTYLSATSKGKPLGKLGKSTYPGYSGTVFEPDDIYKGDFARIYFYMAAAYNSKIANWNSDMLAKNSYPVYTTWAINMLLEWSRLDAVSDKEVKRNQAVYDGNGGSLKQGNRNPFVDHPELAEYIWGNKMGQPWYSTATADPTITSPTSSSTIDFGVVATGSTSSRVVTVKGVNLGEDLELSVSGNGFTTSTSTVSIADATAGKDVTIYYVAPATAGTYTATLTIESSECATVSVPIKATVVSGIPASVSNVTPTSFEARWTSQNDASNYNLYVYRQDKTTLLSGYPVSVTASTGKYVVNGLAPSTTYYFMLKSASLESNMVEVTTLEPERLLDIVTEGSFTINATRGQSTLPTLEASVYTENIPENITLTVSGDKFDISRDKETWGKQLVVDSDGETFYVRLNSVDNVGTFNATLTASTAHYGEVEKEVVAVVESSGTARRGDVNADGDVDIADVNCAVNVILGLTPRGTYDSRDDVNADGDVDIADVNTIINIILGLDVPATVDPTTYVEDWEGCETGGYWSKVIQGNQWKWNIVDAGFWTTDTKHGSLSCRLGKSAKSELAMAEDIATGASRVSFWAAKWSGDANVALSLSYSTDGGKTWTLVRDYTVNQTDLTEFTADVNIAGNVRFRLVQSSGSRGNIDDITIVDNPNAKASTPLQVVNSTRSWDAVASASGIVVTTARKANVVVYDLEAQEVASTRVNGNATIALPAGTYIVAIDKQSKKVIVK